MQWTRRDLLERCAAFGVLTIAIPTTLSEVVEAWEQAKQRRLTPTPQATAGPFYKPSAPLVTNLRAAGDPGMPLSVTGGVFSENGEKLSNVKVEIWQTNAAGEYDLKGNRYRGTIETGSKSAYSFESVMPGHYPGRIAQHVHYRVSAPGHKVLTTQLCFATDPAFEGDPDKTYSRDPIVTSRELIRPVIIRGDAKQMVADVTFDLVLERA